MLHMKHKNIITSGDWLDDLTISAAQNLLKRQFPYIDGLLNPCLSEKLAMEPQAGEFIQILNINGNHWITISTIGCTSSTVKVYDSLGGRLPKHAMKVVADLMQCKKKNIRVIYENVQKQRGASDCGCFAVAFATSLCYGKSLSSESYCQQAMREHLISAFDKGKIDAFPTNAAKRRPGKPTIQRIPVYCICRLTDDGSQMVECIHCGEWFHTGCVHIEQAYIVDHNLEWTCEKCKNN